MIRFVDLPHEFAYGFGSIHRRTSADSHDIFSLACKRIFNTRNNNVNRRIRHDFGKYTVINTVLF